MENLIAIAQILGTQSALNNESGNWGNNSNFQKFLTENGLQNPSTIEALELFRNLFEEFATNYKMQFLKLVSEGKQEMKNFKIW